LTQVAESWLKPDCSPFERDRQVLTGALPGWACIPAYFLEKLTDAR
jgi:hypothetical protein